MGYVQLDVEVVFDYPNVARLSVDGGQIDDGDRFDCSQGVAAHRGAFGPFGLLVLADEKLHEQTAVFFYVSYSREGKWRTRFCSDQTRYQYFHIVATVSIPANKLPTLSLHVLSVAVLHGLCAGHRCCLMLIQLYTAALWRFCLPKTSSPFEFW